MDVMLTPLPPRWFALVMKVTQCDVAIKSVLERGSACFAGLHIRPAAHFLKVYVPSVRLVSLDLGITSLPSVVDFVRRPLL